MLHDLRLGVHTPDFLDSEEGECTYGYDGSVFSNIELSLKYNDPEELALFPYAENALDIYFLLQFGQE